MIDFEINGKNAFTEYGITLGVGALGALMCPAPMKEGITNSVRTRHGQQVAVRPKFDARDVAIPLNLTAPDEDKWQALYNKFCAELYKGKITFKVGEVYYRFLYVSPPSQYSQFRREMASFILRLTEPDPSNRGKYDNNTITTM